MPTNRNQPSSRESELFNRTVNLWVDISALQIATSKMHQAGQTQPLREKAVWDTHAPALYKQKSRLDKQFDKNMDALSEIRRSTPGMENRSHKSIILDDVLQEAKKRSDLLEKRTEHHFLKGANRVERDLDLAALERERASRQKAIEERYERKRHNGGRDRPKTTPRGRRGASLEAEDHAVLASDDIAPEEAHTAVPGQTPKADIAQPKQPVAGRS